MFVCFPLTWQPLNEAWALTEIQQEIMETWVLLTRLTGVNVCLCKVDHNFAADFKFHLFSSSTYPVFLFSLFTTYPATPLSSILLHFPLFCLILPTLTLSFSLMGPPAASAASLYENKTVRLCFHTRVSTRYGEGGRSVDCVSLETYSSFTPCASVRTASR